MASERGGLRPSRPSGQGRPPQRLGREWSARSCGSWLASSRAAAMFTSSDSGGFRVLVGFVCVAIQLFCRLVGL